MGLPTKLAKIIGEIGRIEKRGHNDFHNYDYVMEADLVEALRGHLSKAGVISIPFVDKITVDQIPGKDGKVSVLATIEMMYTFKDDSESITVRVGGMGMDTPGDKAIYKAMTGAEKYALKQLFLIATGDDPERDSGVDKDAGGVSRRPAPEKREKPRASTADGVPSAGTSTAGAGPTIKFGKGKGKNLSDATEVELAEWTKAMEQAVEKNDAKWGKSNKWNLDKCKEEWERRQPWRAIFDKIQEYGQKNFGLTAEEVETVLRTELGVAKADQLTDEHVQKFNEAMYAKDAQQEEEEETD